MTMGAICYLVFALPYMRRTNGFTKLPPGQRYLFVCNHVSLLDTILLGALFVRFWRHPILVLGDKSVWRDSWFKNMLSAPIGFLLERGKLNPSRIRELQTFARSVKDFHLVVFPEGTRGDGVNVGSCLPGIYYIAQEARVPIVPVFIQNMQLVSTKRGKFHPIVGLRKVEVHFGEPVAPEKYLALPRKEFMEFIRQRIAATLPAQKIAETILVPATGLKN